MENFNAPGTYGFPEDIIGEVQGYLEHHFPGQVIRGHYVEAGLEVTIYKSPLTVSGATPPDTITVTIAGEVLRDHAHDLTDTLDSWRVIPKLQAEGTKAVVVTTDGAHVYEGAIASYS